MAQEAESSGYRHMSQQRFTSLVEAAMQAAVGLPIGLGVSVIVASMGLSAALTGALISSLMFIASTLRGYLIRRRFETMSEVEKVMFRAKMIRWLSR